MTIRRITISVPETTASRIKKAAGTAPVSSWVTGIIEEHLDDRELERQWQDFYRAVNPSKANERRAASLLQRLTKDRRRKGAA
jgi:hypothetical protein